MTRNKQISGRERRRRQEQRATAEYLRYAAKYPAADSMMQRLDWKLHKMSQRLRK